MTKQAMVTDPPFARALFNDTRFAWLWLVMRLWLGWTWLSSGWGKLSNPAFMDGGAAVRGFWERAVAVPETGRAPIAFDWYRSFIQFLLDREAYTWFGPFLAISETVVGVALILGAFTGIAAFFGAFMNWNFMMAGTASVNPLMFIMTILLILAWKTAGWIGLDRWLLPALGAPWSPGYVFQPAREGAGPAPGESAPVSPRR
jgi:thiosulfate dehydrogenase [quinone] large subunit